MFNIKKNEIIFTLILFLLIECVVYREYRMKDKPDVGDGRVFHLYSKDGVKHEKHYPSESTGDAIEIINREANKQVNDDSIGFNVFTLEIYTDHDEWEEYYDEEGRDITEIMNEED